MEAFSLGKHSLQITSPHNYTHGCNHFKHSLTKLPVKQAEASVFQLEQKLGKKSGTNRKFERPIDCNFTFCPFYLYFSLLSWDNSKGTGGMTI